MRPARVAIEAGRGPMMSLGWIAEQLNLGAAGSLANRPCKIKAK
jgi:hypothetical protein